MLIKRHDESFLKDRPDGTGIAATKTQNGYVNMKPEQLLEAAETLAWLVKELSELTTETDAVTLAANCTIARMACVELAHHLLSGDRESGAVAKTAHGETAFSEQRRSLQLVACKYLHVANADH